jgi:hypothetical protein
MAALVVLSIHSASMRNPSKRQTNHTLTIAKCQTSTSTVTDTTTLTPLAASTTVYQSPTITLTTTTTSTSTITSTLTSITTSFAPQATYHAACAANNLVTSVSGQTIKGNSFNGGISLRDISNTAANSPYDCCAQCISQSTCAGSAFFAGATVPCVLYSPSNGGVAQIVTAGDAFGSVLTSNGYRPYYQYS